jgi:hypothetical protein
MMQVEFYMDHLLIKLCFNHLKDSNLLEDLLFVQTDGSQTNCSLFSSFMKLQ